MKPLYALLFLAVSCARPTPAPELELAPRPALAPDLRAELARTLRQGFESQGLVGLSCAIVADAQIAEVEHLGSEDRERNIPTSDATLYRWASISKTLTAVVALQLAREQRLALDQDVRAYVPEFDAKPWPITARELLCHQGGIVHYDNGPVIALPAPAGVEHPYNDVVAALDTFRRSPLVCEPGTKFSYSTHGYILLGAVCQRAAGRPYDELVHERIARKLGLITLQPDRAWMPIEHRTPGYRKDETGAVVLSVQNDVSWKLPGGGFVSNVRDLARYGQGLLANELLHRETRDQAWTAQPTRDGTPTEYGLGFHLGEQGGEKLVFHSGSQEKTRTRLVLVPARGWAIALMSNSEWAQLEPIAKALVDVLLAAPSKTASSDLATVEMTLERTECFGWCPSYCVRVRGDGRVEYYGSSFVRDTGDREGRISEEAVRALLERFDPDRFFALSESYSESITDLPSEYVGLRVGEKRYKVLNYWLRMSLQQFTADQPFGHGSEADWRAHEQLSSIADAIDAAVNIEQWIGSQAEREVLSRGGNGVSIDPPPSKFAPW